MNYGIIPEFTAVQNELQVVTVDEKGNKCDIFGEAIEGPRDGESLKQAKAFIAYWYGWAAFYPNALIAQ